MQEQYTVHRTNPDYGINPVTYINVGQKMCQVPTRLNLKPGDKIIIERAVVESPSTEIGQPASYARDRKKVTVPDDGCDD